MRSKEVIILSTSLLAVIWHRPFTTVTTVIIVNSSLNETIDSGRNTIVTVVIVVGTHLAFIQVRRIVTVIFSVKVTLRQAIMYLPMI